MNFNELRNLSQARIGLSRAGHALSTKEWLQFSYDHACATDAVMKPWDPIFHAPNLESLGLISLELCSHVNDRKEYLARPDLGRMLHPSSATMLTVIKSSPMEIIISVTNGLSSLAVEHHLDPLLGLLVPQLEEAGLNLYKTLFFIPNGRVALIDEIGEILRPRIGIIIVGERPGLSAPDSLGIYLTFQPKKGRHDAERNVISNIRPPHGLCYEESATKTLSLIKKALTLGLSGTLISAEVLK